MKRRVAVKRETTNKGKGCSLSLSHSLFFFSQKEKTPNARQKPINHCFIPPIFLCFFLFLKERKARKILEKAERLIKENAH